MFCISDAFIDGDRIRKTIERLNNEWLEKMWKVSDNDIRTFRSIQVYDFLKERWS